MESGEENEEDKAETKQLESKDNRRPRKSRAEMKQEFWLSHEKRMFLQKLWAALEGEGVTKRKKNTNTPPSSLSFPSFPSSIRTVLPWSCFITMHELYM